MAKAKLEKVECSSTSASETAPELLEGLNDAEVLGISKVVKEGVQNAARDALKPGKYEIDATVSVKGTMSIGQDYLSSVAMRVPVWDIAAIALSKVNAQTRQAVYEEAVRRLNDSIKAKVEGADVGESEDVTLIKKEAAEVLERLKDEVKSKCRGRVTTKLVLSKLVPVSEEAKK